MAEQVIVCLFMQHTTYDGTISQFKSLSAKLLSDLLAFVNLQDDEDDDEGEASVMDKVKEYCQASQSVNEDQVKKMYADLNRCFRMFYLQQQMKGMLKDHKEDYFV